MLSGDLEDTVFLDDELSEFGKGLYDNRKHHSVENGLLIYKSKGIKLPVVPRKYVRKILEELHAGPGGGHLGVNKLSAKIESRFWWPNYVQDLKSFVRACEVCGRAKEPNPKPLGHLQPIVTGRFNQVVGIDIARPFPYTQRRNQYVLVMIDFFTKWVKVACIPDQTTATVISAITDQWISRHGVPERLHSDQGSCFESSDFARFCRAYHMRNSHSTPYHPQGNGLMERFNRTFKSLLRTHVTEEHEWDRHVPLCLMAYRSSIQESTRHSPYELLYGRPMQIGCDNLSVKEPNEELRPGVVYWKLKEKLGNLRESAHQNLRAARSRQTKNYERKSSQNSIIQEILCGCDKKLFHDTQSYTSRFGPCEDRAKFRGSSTSEL